jgi:hypothetical protein
MNFLPGPGWLIKGATAGTVIKSMGEAVISFYEAMEDRDQNAA